MNPTLHTAALAILGLAMGTLNAVGLWYTARALPRAARPVLLLAASTIARLLLTITPVVLLARSELAPLAAGVAGFIVARIATVRVIGLRATPGPPQPDNTEPTA